MRLSCLGSIPTLCVAIFMLMGAVHPGLAQVVDTAPDYVEWRSVSERTERLVERGPASKGVLGAPSGNPCGLAYAIR